MRRLLLAAACLSGVPLIAHAQPIQGLYVGGGGGLNILESEQIRGATAGGVNVPYSGGIDFKNGYLGLGSVGWAFGNGVRVELEGSYRYNQLAGAPSGSVAQSGHEQKYGAMANVLFDMDIGSRYVFPYVGAGAGYQWVRENDDLTLTNGSAHFSGTEGGFAYQAIGGAAFPIPGVVGLSVTAEYRFMGINGERSYDGTVSQGGVTTSASRKLSSNMNNSGLIGVRYAFNVPPPPSPAAPAPAAPAPVASRSYLVFFDWDRSDLSARARQIIAEAAHASTQVQDTRIEVDGHADRSGTPQDNQGLSQRRADAVAAELVRLGVAKTAITVQAFGDTRPLVQTAAGVREAQNRRVEIIMK